MAVTYRRQYPPAQDITPAEGSPALRDLLKAVWRRRRLLFWLVVLSTVALTLVGLQTTKTYTARALVEVEAQRNQVVDIQEVVQDTLADAATIETRIGFIRSHENLGRAVDQLSLHVDPQFVGGGNADEEDGNGLAEAVASWLPEAWLPEDWPPDTTWLPESWLIVTGLAEDPTSEPEPVFHDPRERAIAALASNLSVSQSGRGHVVAISYTSTDPQRAAWIANGVAAAFIEGQVDDKVSATQRANSWLSDRVADLKQELLAAEAAVAEYRGAEGLVGSDESPLGAQELSALTAKLIDARAERTASEAKLRLVRDLQASNRGYESVAEVLSSPMVSSLRQQEAQLARERAMLSQDYGERHPRIIQLEADLANLRGKIGQEIQSVIAQLENDVVVARSREQALAESLEKAKGESAVTGQAAIQLRELEREAEAYRELYETFLTRQKETEEQQQFLQADARIISPAQTPNAPSSPSTKLFTGVGFTASLVLGLILTVLLEQLDNRMRSTRQVEELLDVPALAMVPKVTKLRRRERLHDYLMSRPSSFYAESVRGLFTQMQLSGNGHPPTVVAVTSSLPGEGKTSLAASLAVVAAQLQRRTLLIDLDLRRPRVASEFDLDEMADFVGFLTGSVPFKAAVRRDPATGVDLLAAVRGYSNPIALLTSERLALLLRQARQDYDFVMVDAPPVLGMADAKVLSPQVDATVFVVQWEKTKADAAQAAMKELRDVGANVVGAMISQVDFKRHAQYSYGDAGQYYSKYQKYYVN